MIICDYFDVDHFSITINCKIVMNITLSLKKTPHKSNNNNINQ